MARLSIRSRFTLVLLLLVGLGGLVQVAGFLALRANATDLQGRTDSLNRLESLDHQLEATITAQHDSLTSLLLTGATTAADAYRAARVTEAEFDGASAVTLAVVPEIADHLAAVRSAMDGWRTQFADSEVALVASQQLVAARLPAVVEDGDRRFAMVEGVLSSLDDHVATLRSGYAVAVEQIQTSQAWVFVLSMLGGLIGVIAALWLLGRWIQRPLAELLDTARRVKAGEAIRFHSGSDDEIGRLGGELERMREGMFGQAVEAGVVNRFTELTAFVEADADVARATLDALAELVHPDDGAIHISNRSKDRAVPEGSVGAVDAVVIPLGQLGVCPGVRRSSLYVTSDVGGPLAVRCPLHPATAGTLACIPLIALGDVVGAVHLHWDAVDALPLEVRGAVTRITDHASLAIANRRLMTALQGQASTDSRTGLPNSRAFDEALEALLATRDARDPLALLMLDVDHFKRFNDRNGHPAGDQALRTFAAILRGSLRDGDMAARYGGEEFCVMLPGTSAADAMAVAERIRERTEASVIELSPGHRDQFTVSIGVALWPTDATDRVRLLETSDAALYRAKGSGRNRVVLAGEALVPRQGVEEATPTAGDARLTVAADLPAPVQLPRAG